ncbi:MAG: hydroxyisourate hydrolase [Ignavibacteria bacterium]|nr:hydroxyisourate hydrolase [Ignavibacteria bacterium]
MSLITTHVLDTSTGKPATGVKAELFFLDNTLWKMIAEGITNEDGRITDLLNERDSLQFGLYKLKFETGDFFFKNGADTFYPYAEITFKINDDRHYHIPLLISPFGFTTYRGS